MELIGKQIAIETILGQPPELHYPSWYAAQIEKLPPAPPEYLAEQAGILVTDADTISRQAAIDRLTEYGNGRAVFISVGEAIIRIEQLPSTQPERIKGRWIAKEKKNLFRCSKCDAVIYSESEYDRNEFYKFCGRCGADMREVTT